MSAAKEGSSKESGTTTLVHGSMSSSSSLEKPEEPVDESTLKWRQTVDGNKSPNALRRWYLKSGSDGTCCGSDSPTQPLTININDRWEAELPLKGVEDGYYRVVLCVTPRCTDLSSVNTVTIEGIAKRTDGLYTQKPADDSTVTIVPRDEIYGFPPEQFTRLKLHRQAYYQADAIALCVIILFGMEDEAQVVESPFMDIHYIEIEPNQAQRHEEKDHVVYGDEYPTQVIRVGIENTPCTRPVRIAAVAFSDAGEFVTTFYLTEGFGHIDIWDIRSQSGKGSSSSPQVITVPCAQAKVEVSKADPSSSPEINLDISKYGSQVALCTEEETKGGISFRVFKWNPASPVDHDLSQPWPLQSTTTICDNGYYNMFSYHTSDPLNSKEEDERFCICDGLSFTVYNTVGKWTQIYRISMQQNLSFLAADQALDSLQGRYFAWLNTNGVISVWDFETGKLVSHILTGDDSASNPELSLDGSMLAVTISGTIQFYDTFTGIKLGVFREGLSEESDIDYVLGQDHFLTYNLQESTVSKPCKHNVRSVVNVRNMSIVKNYDIHEDYYSQYLQAGKSMLFTYTEGSNVTIRNMGDILSTAASDECGVDGVCPKKPVIPIILYSGCDHRLENVEGTKFIVECRVPLISGDFTKEIDITVDDGAADGEQRTLSIPVGVDLEDFYAFFIPATSQLVYLAENNLMIWTLYAEDPICELSTIWKVQEDPPGTLPSDHVTRGIVSAQVCEHGRSFSIELTRPKWYRATVSYREMVTEGRPDTLTMPISASDTLSTSEEYRTVQGVLHLINVYRDGTVDCKQAIVRYLQERIRPSPKHPASSLATICKAWTLENRGVIENLVDELLPDNRITWVPDSKLTKEQDPLAIILKHAMDNPIAIKVAKVIMSYCVTRANKSMNLAFLAPLFGSLYNIMDLFPDEAARQLSRIAYIPVKNRSYILDNHILVHQPQFRLQFWKPNNQPLCKTKYPIMQLHVSDEIPDVSIKSFTRPVFSTSFDALWYYRDAKALGSSGEVKAEASDTTTTTWWRTLFRMIRLKTQLRAHSYVECYDFNLEFFDNPAITALVTYKWNTIGYIYWAVRFIFQCCYYALVVIAAIMQVYYPEPSKLVGLFIAIIALSVVFLWLELLQAVRNLSRYARSQYNFIDMWAFLLPMGASIHQLVIIYQKDSTGNTKLLSFSVLIVFLHMLFELRVFKSVCKYTAIIQQTVFEIRVFFIIFAAGIFAFTIAILHLLRSCPYEGCEAPETGFSDHFAGALSATYFFMGGIWDPIGDEFKTHRWAFHIMMAIYFFFTVIVMLNVLIALINKAYEKGDDGWRLVWIESRLRFIESAENMSYHIPGFRQTHNYFPKEIYFSATLQQVKEYRQKYNINSKQKEEEDDELNIAEDWLQDILGEDGYQDEEDEEEEEDTETENGNNNNSNNEDNSEDGDGDEDADGNDGGDEGDDGDNGNNGNQGVSDTSTTKAVDKKLKKKQSESKLDRRSSTREKKDKKEKKDTKDTKDKKIARKKGTKVAIEPGWTTDEEGGNEDKDGGAPRAQDTRTIRRLNTKIGDLHDQVGELKTQIGGLQKHLATQLSAQRQQAQRQREEYQELKNLLQALHKQ